MSTILQCHLPRSSRLSRHLAQALLILVIFAFSGCDSPDHTVKSLEKSIIDFKIAPDDTKQAEIDTAFTKLESQITKLEEKGNSTKVEYYRREKSRLEGDYTAAKIARAVNDAKNAVQSIGDSIKQGARDIGDAFKKDSKKENQ